MRLQQRISRLWQEEYLDAPYRLGGLTREDGYDCLSLVYTMLCRLGADVKPYWRDLDITNYWVDYDLELLPEWVRSLGEEVGTCCSAGCATASGSARSTWALNSAPW